MKKKNNQASSRILILVFVLLAVVGAYLAYLGYSGKSARNERVITSSSEITTEDAPFERVFPEKMDGLFLIDETYDGKIYVAVYSDGENTGFIRKSVGSGDNSGVTNSYPEKSEQEIEGVNVTFKGRNGKVNLATWENNNIVYSIGIRVDGEGVSPEDMTEYVKALR